MNQQSLFALAYGNIFCQAIRYVFLLFTKTASNYIISYPEQPEKPGHSLYVTDM
jgi:hypothetical protein